MPSEQDERQDRLWFEALVMHSRDLVTVVDPERRLVWANPAFREMLGEEPDAHLGRPAWEIVHPDDRERLGRIFAEVSGKPGASVTFECRLAHADGSWRRVEVHQVNRLNDPAVGGFVGNTRDISGHVAIAEKLAFEAMHDPLTGLPNRPLLFDRLQQILARVERGQSRCTVMFLDLDTFKTINDRYGHALGDVVLQRVATRLAGAVRPGDTAARFGGDEFVIVVEHGTDVATANDLATRIRRAVRDPIDIADQQIVVTCSIGVAAAAPDLGTEDVLQAADLAMYRAKRTGGDCIATESASLERQR